MEKAKVYFSDLRTSPTSNLLDKMERLLKRAGIGQLPLKDSFTAIKIHFGEPGNLAYIRPNYAARMANLLRSFGAKPFLTDCNTLYSGRRSNAVDHLQSAMENGFNPISAQCQVIIADGLKGTDYREIPVDGEYCPAPKIGTAIADADIIISMNHFKGNDAAIIPDLGMLASADPVALDKAGADLVIQAPVLHSDNVLAKKHEHEDLCGCDKFHMIHPDTDWLAGLRHAEKIGLGTMDYELIKI